MIFRKQMRIAREFGEIINSDIMNLILFGAGQYRDSISHLYSMFSESKSYCLLRIYDFN